MSKVIKTKNKISQKTIFSIMNQIKAKTVSTETSNTDPGTQTQNQPTQEMINALQKQIETQTEQISNLARDKDAFSERFAKIAGFLDGSGVAKYDPETGQITKIEQKKETVNPEIQIQNEINNIKNDLKKKVEDGEISQEEYWEKLEDKITPLQEKKYDIKLNSKLSKIEEKLEKQNALNQSKASKTVTDKYLEIEKQYPDVSNKNSPLFKKMNEIYSKNDLYKDASYDNGKGNPAKFRDLILRAETELKAEGVMVTKHKDSIRNQFASPVNRGYSEPIKTDDHIGEDGDKLLISQGFKDDNLRNKINGLMKDYNNTGTIYLED